MISHFLSPEGLPGLQTAARNSWDLDAMFRGRVNLLHSETITTGDIIVNCE